MFIWITILFAIVAVSTTYDTDFLCDPTDQCYLATASLNVTDLTGLLMMFSFSLLAILIIWERKLSVKEDD